MTESSQETLQKPLEGFEAPLRPKTKLEEAIEKGKKIVYFPPGTPPERKRFGYAQNQITAVALERFLCYRGASPDPRENYWTIMPGDKFGTPPDKARRKPFNSEIQRK